MNIKELRQALADFERNAGSDAVVYHAQPRHDYCGLTDSDEAEQLDLWWCRVDGSALVCRVGDEDEDFDHDEVASGEVEQRLVIW